MSLTDWGSGQVFTIFSIDQDVIQIYHNKDIKLFSKNLIDIALKTGWGIGKTKAYDQGLEVAVSGMEGRFLLVALSDFHPMISTSEI